MSLRSFMVKVSIVVPFHWMDNWPFFLERCLKSIEIQSFKDYEVIMMKVGSMPVTSNRVIEGARGELIKILYLDDYLAHSDSLKNIVDAFREKDKWLVTGCVHDNGTNVANPHYPEYTENISTGNNCIGSPSVLTFRREGCLYFDEKLSFALDCDLYYRYNEAYGPPTILNDLNVVIGLHSGQTTNRMPQEEKMQEFEYVTKKHA